MKNILSIIIKKKKICEKKALGISIKITSHDNKPLRLHGLPYNLSMCMFKLFKKKLCLKEQRYNYIISSCIHVSSTTFHSSESWLVMQKKSTHISFFLLILYFIIVIFIIQPNNYGWKPICGLLILAHTHTHIHIHIRLKWIPETYLLSAN